MIASRRTGKLARMFSSGTDDKSGGEEILHPCEVRVDVHRSSEDNQDDGGTQRLRKRRDSVVYREVGVRPEGQRAERAAGRSGKRLADNGPKGRGAETTTGRSGKGTALERRRLGAVQERPQVGAALES